jgi:hypothetical protein
MGSGGGRSHASPIPRTCLKRIEAKYTKIKSYVTQKRPTIQGQSVNIS